MRRRVTALICFLLALSLLLPTSLLPTALLPTGTAFATTATQDLNAEPNELQQLVEESAKTYEEARANLASLEAEIEQNDTRIIEIEKELPGQIERSSEAIRTLYFMQREGWGFLGAILNAQSFTDVVNSFDYLYRIQKSSLDEIDRLDSMKKELESTQKTLEGKKKSAQEEASRAEASLAEAQAARQEAQERALAEAAAQAAAEAEALEKERQAQEAARAAEEAAENAEKTPEPENPEEPPAPANPSQPDEIDWSEDKQVFVDEWTGRIDAYLAGTPLEGQGKTFAEAAWDYGVDPRWSPAISEIESSRGRSCFLPHNAWGWGSVSWGSWEEAISAHIRGLARGYGYTVSVDSAKKYCPYNWEHWYNRSVEEINKI